MHQTGNDYRKKANERLKKYREKMKMKGYKNFSVYLHQSNIDLVQSIKDDLNMKTREDVIEHIFNTFTSVTCNTPETINSENTSVTCNTSETITIDLSESERDQAVLQVYQNALLPNDKARAQDLNDQGFTTATGKQFTAKNLYRAKKKAMKQQQK